jgi:carbonic anhydrase
MSQIVEEVLAANKKYASTFGSKKDLALPPARGFAILTCMDARLDPAKYAGLSEGDAHVIRNAGGRASDDAIRSLVISHKLLGTREWFVIHHTNCGMELFTDDVIGDLFADSLETAKFDGKAWSNPKHGHGASAGQFVKWHTIKDKLQALFKTYAVSANTHLSQNIFRSTATSTTSTPVASLKSPMQPKLADR